MNNFSQLCLIACFSLSLTACGGGGGGGNTSSPSGSGTSSSTVELKDLKIDSDNALESVYHVSIDVALNSLIEKQAYISICDNSKGIDNIDYNQCLIKASLIEGTGQFDLRVANHCDSLVAVISVMDPDIPVMYYQHNHENQLETTWNIQ